MLTALIMAGGKGTRFWPLSTEERPKQFLNLIGEDTMIQMTVNRILPIIPLERIFICTGEKYVDLVKEQLPDLSERNIIVEPEGRNTAPCITLSAMVIKRYYQNATMVVLPSDHLINNENKFREIVKAGREYLHENENAILTLGMTSTRPETGYGYIKYSNQKTVVDEFEVIKVDAFVEKPNEEKAKMYLEQGTYLWNGGMFMWKVNNILNEIRFHVPSIYEELHNIEEVEEDRLQELINEKYKYTEAISIDYAVLEKSKEIFVIPSDIGWDDIGSWSAIERYRHKDNAGNVIAGDCNIADAEKNIIITEGKKLVLVGVKNLLAVETEDTIYIVNKRNMDQLKDYKEILKL